MARTPHTPRLFHPGTWWEDSRIAQVLRAETTGGVLLIIGAILALIWANSPGGASYASLRDWTVGPASLHLNLSLGSWAADGLLAIFFFVAGLELKREFVAGDLRDPRRALLPVAAAVGGMIAPAAIFVLINLDGGGASGWAIPTATDIAFAVAILAVISSHLPTGLRTFLLTLAVVDDLLAIVVIAIFYTSSLHLGWLLLALVPLALFALLVQRRVRRPELLLPLALATWALVHASGIHATVAGVALAFVVPVLRRDGDTDKPGLAEHFEHLLRPISAGFAVPVFAFFAAGVAVGGWSGFTDALSDRVAIGIVVGLVLGKTIGITAATWLLSRFTRAELDENLAWIDVLGMSILAGIGFTVSLLIGELAYGPESLRADHVKVGVLSGSVLAAAVASVVLGRRNRHYRETEALASRGGQDGVPDSVA